MQASYMSMEYGTIQHLPCNVHRSGGTIKAQHPHYHDFYQIYFVQQGSLFHHVGKRRIQLFRGDCFLIPPNCAHYIEIAPEMPTFYSFSFEPTFIASHVNFDPSVSKLLTSLDDQSVQPKISLPVNELYRMEQLMTFALNEFDEREQGWECALKGLLAAILAIFARAYLQHRPGYSEDNVRLLECIQYINDMFYTPIRLSELLKKTVLSRSTFYRVFKQMTGQSFKQYLTTLRIRHACMLLKSTDRSVALIAHESGFSDPSVFYRCFIQQIGVSPTAYRNAIDETPIGPDD